MQEICPKMNAEVFERRNAEETTYGACDSPFMIVTVRRLQRSAVAEGRWGSLTKCGVTKLMTVRRVYDDLSCIFFMKFREVISVPIFQELKCYGTKTLDELVCL